MITVSALMLLAGTAGAYTISELGFYTRSIEDIREEQFERIAGKYSARVLLNLNNTENETYFKDTNFRYGVVEASNYEELEKLDLNQQNTYVQSNFDEKVSLGQLHLFQCNINDDTSIYVDNSVLGGYYIAHSTREYRNKYINEYVYDTDSGIFYYQVSDVSSAQISEEEAATEICYFPVSEGKWHWWMTAPVRRRTMRMYIIRQIKSMRYCGRKHQKTMNKRHFVLPSRMQMGQMKMICAM